MQRQEQVVAGQVKQQVHCQSRKLKDNSEFAFFRMRGCHPSIGFVSSFVEESLFSFSLNKVCSKKSVCDCLVSDCGDPDCARNR